MKLKLNKKSLNSGFTLVENIIAVAILGVGALVYMKSSSSFLSIKNKTVVAGNLDDYQSQALAGTRLMLFDTKNNSTHLKDEGLCKLIKKGETSRPPVGAININLSKLGEVLSSPRWKKYLPAWSIADSDNCAQDPLKNIYCFTLNPAAGIPKDVSNLDLELKVVITPQNMDPTYNKLFTPLKGNDLLSDIDVKRVGFDFRTTIYYKNSTNESIKSKTISSFDWTGIVGYCDYSEPSSGKKYRISMTGMETVMGTPDRPVIFNTNGFGENSSLPEPIDTYFKPVVAQKGTFNKAGSYIYTSSFIHTSCKEIHYRCPQVESSQREYSDLSVVAKLDYNFPNDRTSTLASVNTKMKYSIMKNGSPLSISHDKYYGFDVDCSDPNPPRILTGTYVDNRGSTRHYCEKANSITRPIGEGHDFSAVIYDKGSIDSTNHLCQEICNKNTNYNTNGDPNNTELRYTGELEFSFLTDTFSNKKQISRVPTSIGCTACYMKNCNKFGLGTFGSMSSMPEQPLDSNIPECVVNEDKKLIYDDLVYKNLNMSFSGNSKCLVAKYSSATNSFNLENRSCSSQKNVMCYGYGTFMLSKKISESSFALAKGQYADAAENCFDVSREIINQEKLDAAIGSPPTGLAKNGRDYDFFNLASQGIFLAPQTTKDTHLFATWCDNGNQPYCNNEFWVGLIKDGDNNVISRVPVISSKVNSSKDAVFYNKNKALQYVDVPQKLVSSGITGKAGAMLIHNLKYKGVKWVNKEKPFGHDTKFNFLCRKKDYPFEFIVSNSGSFKFEDGKDICDADNAWFIPPMTPVEWTAAMLLTNPNDQDFPFPDPTKVSEHDGVWVAVETTSFNDASGVDWDIYSNGATFSSFLSTSGYDPTTFGDTGIALNEVGKYISPYAMLKSVGSTSTISISKGTSKFKFKIDDSSYTVEFVNSNDSILTKTPSDFVNAVNSRVGSTVMLYKDGTFYLKSPTIGGGGSVKIKHSDFVFFHTTPSRSGPSLKKICLDVGNHHKFVISELSRTCSLEVSRNDLETSILFKTLWMLYRGSGMIDTGSYYFEPM